MTTKKTTVTTTATKTKASNAKAAKADAKPDAKTTTKTAQKATTKASTGGERLRKAALAEIGQRLAAADPAPQDHEVPSPKEVANTANLRATTTVKVAKLPKEPKQMKQPKPAKEPTPRKTSALDAAAIVLASATEPMGTKDLIERMAARGLWTSPGGKTPEATLYAAILREIGTKKDTSRFAKVERGRFVATTRIATDGKAA